MAIFGGIPVVAALTCMVAVGQENPLLAKAESLIFKGDYEQARDVIQAGYAQRTERVRFATLDLKALMALGRYDEAVARGANQWRRSQDDRRLCLEIAKALVMVGRKSEAEQILGFATQTEPPETPVERIAHGEALLALKRDPKEVLQKYLEPAKRADPTNRAAYLAIGRLGLVNHDRQLAAENLREGLKRFPNDPEFLLGLAEAGDQPPNAGTDSPSYVDLALQANPRFPEALLFKAQRLSDGKKFDEAIKTLQELFAINSEHPEAWAQMAMIALVRDNPKSAEEAQDKARMIWSENPRIPEIIGTGLARHYRFAEGIDFLEKAHREDPESVSIRFELGSNLLRFGRIDDGWQMIDAVHQADPYHVAAFNLITLRDRLKGFPIIDRPGVKLRMSPEDTAVFGDRAADLALKAKDTLAAKYGVTLSQPVMVELLPTQEDFAIRTFGLPGGESFLGVCFGPLITMTSPRGRLGRNNWESVLWHEMAHTITLEASRHRIPRWFTEGISVYEERQAAKGRGLGMNSGFRERFLSGNFPKIAELDEAFAGEDIMLGYYQSSLVVEHLFETQGIEKIRGVLTDLAGGMTLEKSFASRGFPLPELQESFNAYVTKAAKSYGEKIDWSPLTDEEYRSYREDPAAWVSSYPERYASSLLLISNLTKAGEWAEAKTQLDRIIALEPNNREEFNPYQQLAIAHRNLNDPAGERTAWQTLLDLDANSAEAASKLVELSNDESPAERVVHGNRLLAINPFSEAAYRAVAAAASDQTPAYLSLIALGSPDASHLHCELASLLRESKPDEARLHVLKALEDNPRFLKALELLTQFPPRP